MITVNELEKAIAECLRKADPDAYTCIKLAAYYIIRDKLSENVEKLPSPEPAGYLPVKSLAKTETIDYIGNTDFIKAVNGRNTADVVSAIDDLMSMLKVVCPELYEKALQRFAE